jgi:hypothetical protein
MRRNTRKDSTVDPLPFNDDPWRGSPICHLTRLILYVAWRSNGCGKWPPFSQGVLPSGISSAGMLPPSKSVPGFEYTIVARLAVDDDLYLGSEFKFGNVIRRILHDTILSAIIGRAAQGGSREGFGENINSLRGPKRTLGRP